MKFSLSSLFSSIAPEPSAAAPNRVVGIDIGSSSVKIVELENTERAITLRTYGELQLGPYADAPLGDTVVLNEVRRTEAVVDILREAEAESRVAVLALPLSSSFVTVISVTPDADGDVSGQIPVVARKYIPVPVADVTLDWSLLDSPTNTEKNQEVLLAAIQNDSMNSFNGLLQAISMTSQSPEIETFSAMRSVPTSEDAVAVLDMGARVSKLYVIRNGALERIHRVSVGGADVTRKLAQLRGIDFAQAETLKRLSNPTDEIRADVKRATEVVLERPLQEFKRILDTYQSRLSLTIADVQVVGGVGASIGIDALISNALNTHVNIGNPFDRIAYPAFMEDSLRQIGPSFAVSLGAALRPLYS